MKLLGLQTSRSRVPVLLLVIALLAASPCAACTVFSYAVGEILRFGNSEDYDLFNTRIWFVPPGGSLHGALCLGFDGPSLQGGMNDAGLCFDATAGTSFILNAHPEKPRPPGVWTTYLLAQCATVDDVIAFMNRYDFSYGGIAQMLFLDRNGDSLIVTSGVDGEIVFLRKHGGYRLITNFNVTARWRGTYPCWRYDFADGLLRSMEVGAMPASPTGFRNILAGVRIPGYTRYSNLFDPVALTATIYREGDFADARTIDLQQALDAGGGHYLLEDYFRMTAEASGS
ncbi:MAG: hypothetical protein JSW65_05980 [Candidatus Bipolaricaulota bacterium]|nr:MAG: hypothetical protein JSW65_05980 [Candidatus Bipolaricaulota bacterium]